MQVALLCHYSIDLATVFVADDASKWNNQMYISMQKSAVIDWHWNNVTVMDYLFKHLRCQAHQFGNVALAGDSHNRIESRPNNYSITEK